jgi:hypothetical protein
MKFLLSAVGGMYDMISLSSQSDAKMDFFYKVFIKFLLIVVLTSKAIIPGWRMNNSAGINKQFNELLNKLIRSC